MDQAPDRRPPVAETAIAGSSQSVVPGVVAVPRDYKARQAEQWCVYSCACPRRAAGYPDATHNFCDRHRLKVQKKQAKAKRKQRAALAEASKCIVCRKPSPTYRHPECRIRDGSFLPRASVASGVVADPFRKDGDGWARYRGKGRRGAPMASVDDDQDLERAIGHVTRGREAMAYARSPEVTKLGRIQQAGAMRAALAELLLAARFLESVVDRREPKDG